MTNFINLAPVKETTIKGDDFLIFDSLEFRNQSTNNEQITKWTTTRGGDRKSIDYILTIVIHLYTQPLNNLPVKRYGAIFRHVREDFIDITTRARMRRKTHCMGLNFKCWFCQSIKRRIGKQKPPISGIKLKDYFLSSLASFSRQVAITQAEKLVFSFLDCSSIRSINSWGKRIAFLSDLLFLLPVAIFIPKRCLLVCRHYTRSLNNKKGLTCAHTIKYSEHTPDEFIRLKKQSPDVLATLSRDLTKPLNEVMIMANSYDSACLRAEQSKLLKFYDLSIIDKNRLHEFQNLGYINLALAKSSVRIETLFILLATHDALCVFFCVNAYARLFIKSFSMVALVGHPKGWLASSRASSLNPANVTANEIETSSGDYLNNYLLEAVIMTTTPTPIVSTQKLYKFYDLSTAQVIQTTATTERQARKNLGKQSLIFIARIRITPIIERVRTWGGYSHE